MEQKPWVVGQALEIGVCEHLQVTKSGAPFDWQHYLSAYFDKSQNAPWQHYKIYASSSKGWLGNIIVKHLNLEHSGRIVKSTAQSANSPEIQT